MSIKSILTTISLAFMAFGLPSERKTKIFLIGDSTISIKEPKAFPETGWGMPFVYFFDSTVQVENHAKNGRSTRSFLAEDRWTPIEKELRAGDYVLIQFGHNDEAKEKVERFTTPEDYKKNLAKFIAETRAKQATPILLTPVSRRKFKNGMAIDTHEEYAPLVFEVGKQQKVAVIDLNKLSRELYQQMGEESSKLLFLQLQPGEHPNYPEGKIDNTHFNELGARKIAQLVLAELRKLNLPLNSSIVKPVKK